MSHIKKGLSDSLSQKHKKRQFIRRFSTIISRRLKKRKICTEFSPKVFRNLETWTRSRYTNSHSDADFAYMKKFANREYISACERGFTKYICEDFIFMLFRVSVRNRDFAKDIASPIFRALLGNRALILRHWNYNCIDLKSTIYLLLFKQHI